MLNSVIFPHRFSFRDRIAISSCFLLSINILLFKQRGVILGQLSATVARSVSHTGLARNSNCCQVIAVAFVQYINYLSIIIWLQ